MRRHSAANRRRAIRSPSTLLAIRETEAALESALGGLAEHHRNVVLWHHRDRLPFEEVGRRLGISADAARKHWERALWRCGRN